MAIEHHTWSGTVGHVNKATDDGRVELVCGPGQDVAIATLPLPLELQIPHGIVRVGEVTRIERDGNDVNAGGVVWLNTDDEWAVQLLYGQRHGVALYLPDSAINDSGGRKYFTGWKVDSLVLCNKPAWADAWIALTDLPETQQPAQTQLAVTP
jgi:hypothetical protein